MVKIITAMEAREIVSCLDECFDAAQEADNTPLLVRITNCLAMLEKLRKVDIEDVIR